jgi:hypothetical protein
MSRSLSARAIAVFLVVVLGLTAVVLTIPPVQGATWTQDTDTELGAGTLSGVEVVGTGAPATVKLLKDSLDWSDEAPVTHPSQREGPGMAYDSTQGLVVLFGGYGGTYLSDTWVYDAATSTWTQRTVSGPSGREFMGMTFDSANGVIVFFGGVSSGGFESDTWEYDVGGNTWTQYTPSPAPPALASYHLSFDSAVSRSVLTGMNVLNSQMVTWAYNAQSHTWADRAPSAQLPQRVSFMMGYQGDLDRVVVFGGLNPFPPPGALQSDTYEYDWTANTWTQSATTGPAARTSGGVSYRAGSSSLYLFGGDGAGGTPLSDTWRYLNNAGNHMWLTVTTQQAPPARASFGIADEATAGKSVLFGGRLGGGGFAQDTWAFGPAYRNNGFWTSQTFDSGGANAVWNTLAWAASTPAGTILRFQFATSNAPNGPWNFMGPSCNPAAYFTTSPATISGCFSPNRYVRTVAQFISTDDRNTPSLDSITIDYTVAAADPFIVLTDPANGPIPPVPQTQPIFVRFSEEMNPASLLYTINPAISATISWSEGNSAVTFNHAAPLQECKAYTMTITQAQDLAGNNLAAGPVPNPFSFVTECIYPYISATNPSQGALDVPLAAPIVVDFSENMDTATVTWTITPALAGVTGAWSNGTQRLTLSHTTDFTQCTVYQVNITGKDLAALSLIPGPAPNPWTFQVHCTVPYIVTTSPFHLEIDVALARTIIVTFSEPMNTGTVTWTIAPAITLTAAWSNGDRTLTLSHVAPFGACTPYTVDITGGKDADEGNDLYPGQQTGGAAHPWKFMTVCPNPFMVITIPEDGTTGWGQSTNLTVVFDEAMNTGTVTWSISPNIVLVPTWNAQNTALTLAPSVPYGCGENTVQILSGLDADQGNPLVPGLAPNPFRFTPDCPNPIVQTTVPANDATGVALAADVVVTFNKAMDTASVTYGSVPATTFTAAWTVGDTVLTLSHATNFAQATLYTMTITGGQDTLGNPLIPGPTPNPWRFTTVGVNPQILSTDPVDGAVDVPTAANVVITFSEAMNTASVIVTSNPVVVFGMTWTNGDTVLTLSHISPFADCTLHTLTASGNDPDGNPLVGGPAPNPWSFTTVCLNPYITDTNPASAATGVPVNMPIFVNFSKSMNTGSVNVVSNPPLVFTSVWTNGDRSLRLNHAAPFVDCTPYTVTVTGQDTSGNPLTAGPAPNPWTFTAACPSPVILTTSPASGATNVATSFSITVTFSLPMDTANTAWNIAPPASGTTTPTWTVGDTVLTLTFSVAQAECTSYTVTITGQGADGQPLAAGPVPNPWTFSTTCSINPPGGLAITRVGPSTIHLSWTAPPSATGYNVYRSNNRFAAWPWTAIASNIAATSYDAVGDLTDGSTHYYIVRALRNTALSANSTMAVKVPLSVTFGASTTNVRWFSLPYRSSYVRASDIANELGPTRVDVIAKWNPATQSSIIWAYFRGSWRGTDFPIGPGDGLWLSAVSSFSWTVVGTDTAPTLSFTANAPPSNNLNWRGVPYTGTYTQASDLVRDIEGGTGPGANTKIVEIGKWDPTTQTVVRYFWTTSGWTGTDFTIAPGDGIYFKIVSSFTWQPKLVTPEVP